MLARLRGAPAAVCSDLEAEAKGELVKALSRVLETLVAELAKLTSRTEAQLAAEAGICPVTYESGKSRGVGFRWACNHRLRRAITTWADNSRHASPWAADLYARARGRGCDHPHAVRILARAWVRVLWRTWFARTAYVPDQHGGAKKFLAAA